MYKERYHSYHIYKITPKNITIRGLRLFPTACISDSEAYKIARHTGVYLIMEKNDTLYILTDKSEFYNVLPDIGDSSGIIEIYSQTFKRQDSNYAANIIFHIFTNEKDSVVIGEEQCACLIEGKKYPYYWVSLRIRDTLYQFNGLKIGLSKYEFFHNILGINFSYPKKNFVVIMTYFKSTREPWYYNFYCDEAKHKKEWYCNQEIYSTISAIIYVITFRDNRIYEITLYGE